MLTAFVRALKSSDLGFGIPINNFLSSEVEREYVYLSADAAD